MITGTKESSKELSATTDHLINVAAFLSWSSDDGAINGGVHAEDALESFRILLGFDKETFGKLIAVVNPED